MEIYGATRAAPGFLRWAGEARSERAALQDPARTGTGSRAPTWRKTEAKEERREALQDAKRTGTGSRAPIRRNTEAKPEAEPATLTG